MMAGPRHRRLLHDMGMGECASASHDELILGVAALLPRKKGNQGRPVQDTRGRGSPPQNLHRRDRRTVNAEWAATIPGHDPLPQLRVPWTHRWSAVTVGSTVASKPTEDSELSAWSAVTDVSELTADFRRTCTLPMR